MASNVTDFYQSVAEFYDGMTNFEERLDKEITIMKRWRERFSFRNAIDAACGTGIHTIALNRIGIPTIGADISEAMLQKARKHSRSHSMHVQWIQTSMQQLREHVSDRVDLILCLGNSLPHLLDDHNLNAALAGFRQLLNPGGYLAIQILNYQRIMAEKQRMVGIKQEGDRTYLRFYDFLDRTLRFNVLSIQSKGDALYHQWHSTELYPYTEDELRKALIAIGFSRFNPYGDLEFSTYHPEQSNNLILLAQ